MLGGGCLGLGATLRGEGGAFDGTIQISSLDCFNTLNGPLQLIFENPNEGGNVSELTIILESCKS